MKRKFPHHRTISLILQKLAMRHLLNLSATISKLRRIELFKSLVLPASPTRNADRATHKLEYQFSASSTPLIHRYNYKKSWKQYGLQRFCAFLCPCIYVKAVRWRWDDEDVSMNFVTEPARMLMLTNYDEEGEDENVASLTEQCDNHCGFDDCVDEKAERFIAKFYDEIRKQKRDFSGSSQCCEVAVIELL